MIPLGFLNDINSEIHVVGVEGLTDDKDFRKQHGVDDFKTILKS